MKIKKIIIIISTIIAILIIGLLIKNINKENNKKEISMENNDKNINMEYKFPVKTEFTKEYLQKNFWKCNYTNIDSELQYWIILPNNIKPINIDKVENKKLGITEIGTYARIDDTPYIEISVAYEHIPYEMNVSDWLKRKLYLMGETTIHEEKKEGKSTGIYLDALTQLTTEGGENIISRYFGMKDSSTKVGGNYFLVKATCNEKEYNDLAETIFHIITHWDLVNKSKWQMAEMLKPFSVEFNEKIEFYFPASWNAKFNYEKGGKIARFIFEHEINKQNQGVINAYFYNHNDYNSEKEIFNQSIERFKKLENYTFNSSEIKKIPHQKINNKIKNLYISAGSFSGKDFDSFIQIFIIETIKGYYYFELASPKANLKDYSWEINKRCIELMVESFNNLSFEKSENEENINSSEINNQDLSEDQSKVYKNYNGKNYTQEEWIAFEKEQWDHYQKNKKS